MISLVAEHWVDKTPLHICIYTNWEMRGTWLSWLSVLSMCALLSFKLGLACSLKPLEWSLLYNSKLLLFNIAAIMRISYNSIYYTLELTGFCSPRYLLHCRLDFIATVLFFLTRTGFTSSHLNRRGHT